MESKMSTIQIVSRFDGTKVLFECEVTKDQQDSGVAMRHALEKAAGEAPSAAQPSWQQSKSLLDWLRSL